MKSTCAGSKPKQNGKNETGSGKNPATTRQTTLTAKNSPGLADTVNYWAASRVTSGTPPLCALALAPLAGKRLHAVGGPMSSRSLGWLHQHMFMAEPFVAAC